MNQVPAQAIAGRYQPVEVLGEGYSAIVYRCRAPDGRQVAVKRYTDGYLEPKYRSRLAAEARILASTRHPHVIRMLDWDCDEQGRPFLVMELADSSLRDLTCHGRMPVDLSAWIVYQAASGLRAVDAIHRDIKPENLLIANGPDGHRGFEIGMVSGARVVVADWGLCRATGTVGSTRTVDVIGTPLYMSPEQCRSAKHTDKRTDIYALGVVLWELTQGIFPFDAPTPEGVMRQHVEEEPPWPGQCNEDLVRILRRCLAKDARDRYACFADLQSDLALLFSPGNLWSYPPDGIPDARVTGPVTTLAAIDL
jgi:serine/threonine protein kinase